MAGHEDAVIRCSHWNGCDLGTQTGVDLILNTIDTCRPQHVWISPNCGPYSPLQCIKQRSDAQIAQLTEKRRVALLQYIGAKCVYMNTAYSEVSRLLGSGHRSVRVGDFRSCRIYNKDMFLETYVTQGCPVGLRCPKTQDFIHKGWKLLSTNRCLLQGMNLPCRCGSNYQHGRCEGGMGGVLAYYTMDYVKRVAEFLEHEYHSLQQELGGQDTLPMQFGHGQVVCARTCETPWVPTNVEVVPWTVEEKRTHDRAPETGSLWKPNLFEKTSRTNKSGNNFTCYTLRQVMGAPELWRKRCSDGVQVNVWWNWPNNFGVPCVKKDRKESPSCCQLGTLARPPKFCVVRRSLSYQCTSAIKRDELNEIDLALLNSLTTLSTATS